MSWRLVTSFELESGEDDGADGHCVDVDDAEDWFDEGASSSSGAGIEPDSNSKEVTNLQDILVT